MFAASLVRRGMELASDPEQPSIHVSGWLIGLFFFTVLAAFFALFKIEYTYGMVVASLAAIEETNPDIYVRIDTDFDPTKPVDPAAPIDPVTVEAARPKPITSKLRTTIKHLRTRAGYWSRFRGFKALLAYTAAQGFLYSIVSSVVPLPVDSFLGHFIVGLIISVLLANLQLAWIHIVISEPSPKRFYQRIPGYKAWVNFAPMVVLEQVVVLATFFLPMVAIVALGGFKDIDFTSGHVNAPSYRALSLALLLLSGPLLLCGLVSIPVRAVVIRVAASMLPEEDEAIVPFDRSFGGKVTPSILGGSGKVSIRDAWTTFDGPARMRYFKVIAKVVAMQLGAIVFFGLLIGAEVYAGALPSSGSGNK
ncbi:hypothetical protein FE257_006313 [Aspergillus nanangensis]|uniref:Uncharacterized protein n=1 Tax=Aspergillus nanangensis TaxID=2582783 RepID=A0AAD4CPN2_ASPNN|nr:hypothetical protein FE257_006313 [Aspergillus nanangensis]